MFGEKRTLDNFFSSRAVPFILRTPPPPLSLLVRLEMAARGGRFRLRVYLRRTSLAVAACEASCASSAHYTRHRVMHSRTYTTYHPMPERVTNRARLRPRTNGNHSREKNRGSGARTYFEKGRRAVYPLRIYRTCGDVRQAVH